MVTRNNRVYMYKIVSSDLPATAQEKYMELLCVVLWKYRDQQLLERQIAGMKC